MEVIEVQEEWSSVLLKDLKPGECFRFREDDIGAMMSVLISGANSEELDKGCVDLSTGNVQKIVATEDILVLRMEAKAMVRKI